MGKLVDEVRQLTFSWVNKSGKIGRREQARIMLAFARDVENLGPKFMGQVGQKQVILYWKANRHLTDPTLMSRWYSIKHLWILAGKAGEPPKPRLSTDITAHEQTP